MQLELLYDVSLLTRPRSRADCAVPNGVRPCPWASCRHHLMFDVGASGLLLAPFGQEVAEFDGPTCALDVADEGEHSPDEIAETLGITRQAVGQIYARAMAKVRAALGEDNEDEDQEE